MSVPSSIWANIIESLRRFDRTPGFFAAMRHKGLCRFSSFSAASTRSDEIQMYRLGSKLTSEVAQHRPNVRR